MTTLRDYRGNLTLGGVALEELARDPRIGTPSYVYDLDAMAAEARALDAAFDGAPHLVAYAVKANSAGPIVRALAAEGCGADVVSGGELRLARACGIAADKIVFSGVAKSDAELDLAIAEGIHAIHAESIEEVARIDARASALNARARVALRINPAVDADAIATHAHITTGHDEAKFGIPRGDTAEAIDFVLARRARLDFVGITAHAGSQLVSTAGYVESARAVFGVTREAIARGAPLAFVDTGGGFGIDYGSGCPVRPADFVRVARAEQRAAGLDALALNVEPGRALVGAHGVLLAKVIQQKIERAGDKRAWLMIDAGMNDLIRPALYQAFHRVVSLRAKPEAEMRFRVVGPVCESSDDFGPHLLADTGYVAILDAGAYSYSMASRYNGRPYPAEVFLRGGAIAHLSARAAEDAWATERARVGEY